MTNTKLYAKMNTEIKGNTQTKEGDKTMEREQFKKMIKNEVSLKDFIQALQEMEHEPVSDWEIIDALFEQFVGEKQLADLKKIYEI